MLLFGLDRLLKDEIGLRNNSVIIFGVMSVVLRKMVLGLLSGFLGMKVKTKIWLD